MCWQCTAIERDELLAENERLRAESHMEIARLRNELDGWGRVIRSTADVIEADFPDTAAGLRRMLGEPKDG
jgi:hypothetical protein